MSEILKIDIGQHEKSYYTKVLRIINLLNTKFWKLPEAAILQQINKNQSYLVSDSLSHYNLGRIMGMTRQNGKPVVDQTIEQILKYLWILSNLRTSESKTITHNSLLAILEACKYLSEKSVGIYEKPVKTAQDRSIIGILEHSKGFIGSLVSQYINQAKDADLLSARAQTILARYPELLDLKTIYKLKVVSGEEILNQNEGRADFTLEDIKHYKLSPEKAIEIFQANLETIKNGSGNGARVLLEMVGYLQPHKCLGNLHPSQKLDLVLDLLEASKVLQQTIFTDPNIIDFRTQSTQIIESNTNSIIPLAYNYLFVEKNLARAGHLLSIAENLCDDQIVLQHRLSGDTYYAISPNDRPTHQPAPHTKISMLSQSNEYMESIQDLHIEIEKQLALNSPKFINKTLVDSMAVFKIMDPAGQLYISKSLQTALTKTIIFYHLRNTHSALMYDNILSEITKFLKTPQDIQTNRTKLSPLVTQLRIERNRQIGAIKFTQELASILEFFNINTNFADGLDQNLESLTLANIDGLITL